VNPARFGLKLNSMLAKDHGPTSRSKPP